MLDRTFICARCTGRLIRPALHNETRPINSVSRRLNSRVASTERPIRVAIVGSGPAGFYAASRLLSKQKDVMVDMYEKLPVPFGLARYGVAPDHPEVKVSTELELRGQIHRGCDISALQLCRQYRLGK